MDRHGEDLARTRISVTTLGDMLLKSWDRDPARLAVLFPDRRVTYDELVQRAMHQARGLWAAGVRPRDHVGILFPSGIDFVETLFAVSLCGAVAVLMNARYRPPELTYVANNADLTTIVTSASVSDHVDLVARLMEALPELAKSDDPMALQLAAAPKLRRIILRGGERRPGFIDQAAFERGAGAVDEATLHRARIGVRVRDTCMLLYTSGTSSNPKGCMLSHEAIVREAENLGLNRWRLDESDRVWSPLPLYHIAALLGLLSVFHAGGTFIGLPHFDAGASLKQIEEERVTLLFLPFVTFHQAMISHPDFAKTDMSSVRLMNSCFAAMPESVGQVYREKVPQALQCGTFGMTESSGPVTTGGYGMDPELGFTRLGFPLLGLEVRIVDLETGTDVPTGERGEVLVRGYSLFDGYYRDEDKTREALVDGWYHSGDIGSLDEHGHIMFHGRFKEMLKVGGENVAAAEVEAVLARHPAVQLAQVVGIPDARLDEIPAAFIERRDGHDVTADELIAYLGPQIASFKVPRHFRFVEEWPMSASKIQKFKLRDALMRELGLES